MAILGRPQGIFNLNDSDRCIGSYLLKQDIKNILAIDDVVAFIEFDGPSYFTISRYGIPVHHPLRKKRIVEDKTGIEVGLKRMS